MIMVFRGDFCHSVFYGLRLILRGLNDGSSNVEAFSVFPLLSLQEECSLLRIQAPKDYGELHMVDPTSFLIDIRLYCGEPRVPQDGLVVP
jgi:hypothetical protein